MTTHRRHSDPNHLALRDRAATLPHVAAHVGSGAFVRVVKVGGRAQRDAALSSRIHDAVSIPGARIVVVHGGGDEVTALQRRMGVEATFVDSRRVTSADDLDAVRMVLSGTVNKRIVARLQSEGVRAVGVSGEDGGMLTARVLTPALGRVGRDVLSDATLIADLLNGGWVPVISPLARDRDSVDGLGLNVNGDDAAAAIAAGIGADELLFVSDVPGVMNDGIVIAGIDSDAIAALVARGVVQGGMRAKLEAAAVALRNGVHRVRIAALSGIADPMVGTFVSLSSHSTRDPA